MKLNTTFKNHKETMKRKLREIVSDSVANYTRSQKPSLLPGLSPPTRDYFWVSPTKIKNYLMKDPLVDWLKSTQKKTNNNLNKSDFTDFIIKKGIEFEDKLVKYIHEQKIPVVTVSDKITPQSCRKTAELMKEGTPIIHSAPLRDGKMHIRGVADLLVRSDHLQKLVNDNPLPNHLKTHKAPNLPGNYHYVAVDIKFSTLPLRADGVHLLNSGRYPSYKAQVWIYTQLIGKIQGYTPNYGFILGRRWTYTSRGEKFTSLNSLDKLGTIDFSGVDEEYKDRTEKAISWLKDVRKDGKNWTTNPPTREELYPNMCIDSSEWNSEKKRIAEEIGEMTQVWYVGIKHRKIALDKKVKNIFDEKCNSSSLGIKGVRAPVIDKILSINRQNTHKILPQQIKTQLYSWQKQGNEMFVDFETFSDIFCSFDSLPEQPRTNGIFMIGVYYLEGNVWQYRNFVAKDTTREEEFSIMDRFFEFVEKQGKPKLWYWHAEKTIWASAENRVFDHLFTHDPAMTEYVRKYWFALDWADLAKIFRDEPIVIKDCYKFGLKEVSKAMRDHGMVSAHITSECSSGMDATVKAWKVYETSMEPENSPIIKDIAVYNKFDVQVLQEILGYLRENHA